ncbi:hypothetical protein RB200_14440 [Streptomyces sp. PmtG]
MAQQLEQAHAQVQRQRAGAALADPLVRITESAKFASMPTRTAAHTFDVNSLSAMWAMFHLIRLSELAKGLCGGPRGHMAHQPALETARPPALDRRGDPVIPV